MSLFNDQGYVVFFERRSRTKKTPPRILLRDYLMSFYDHSCKIVLVRQVAAVGLDRPP